MNEEFEKYIIKVIDDFTPLLLLQRHTFEVRYGIEDKTALFESVFNYPYLFGIVRYSKNSVKRWEKGEDLIPYIVHEMCHIITDPLYEKAVSRYVTRSEINNERELLTDYICNIVLRKGVK